MRSPEVSAGGRGTFPLLAPNARQAQLRDITAALLAVNWPARRLTLRQRQLALALLVSRNTLARSLRRLQASAVVGLRPARGRPAEVHWLA